jgi:murein DD-endopeptidase MepM/ murein hydrolase activator NlpD
MKLFLFFFVCYCSLAAQVPKAYGHLGTVVAQELIVFQSLCEHPKSNGCQDGLNTYALDVNRTFVIGYRLDQQIEEAGDEEGVLQAQYLQALRKLKKQRKRFKSAYYKTIERTINDKEDDYFLFLIKTGDALLKANRSLKEKVLSYAQDISQLKEDPLIQAYQEEKELDERSLAFTQKMQDEYKAYQEVLRKQEAMKLRQLLVAKKEGGVVVYAQENQGDIDFYMENLFDMHVSSTLHIQNIRGYESKTSLPYKLVLRPKAKVKVLTLYNTDKKKHVGSFSSHISWSKGSVEAQPDLDFIYALPYDKSHKVSQGFNGNTSHKGTSKYAIDFAMPIGTPVLASRSGRVVEIVQRHDKHGMGLKMRSFANYVIIEHADKTLGRYFHLKQNSVTVKLGAEVKAGELLALSGDTGRTSGAHLHFVVTKAQEYKEAYRSVSIPIKFLCTEGIVDKPVKGATYCSVLK